MDIHEKDPSPNHNDLKGSALPSPAPSVTEECEAPGTRATNLENTSRPEDGTSAAPSESPPGEVTSVPNPPAGDGTPISNPLAVDGTSDSDPEEAASAPKAEELPGVIENVVRGIFKKMMIPSHDTPAQADEPPALQGKPKTIPEVRKCNVEMFKNRFGDDDEKYALEVLVAGPNLSHEVRRERDRRQTDKTRYKRATEVATPPKTIVFPKNSTVQRIRIQSQTVLAYLARCVFEEDWAVDEPRTFVYPFRALIYFHPQMRKALEQLSAALGHLQEETAPVSPNQPGPTDPPVTPATSLAIGKTPITDSLDDIEAVSDPYDTVLSGLDAYRELRCYIDFIDREVWPLAFRYHPVAPTEKRKDKVSFDDLWLLYTRGETVFCPTLDKATSSQAEQAAANNRPAHMSQQLWRVYGVTVPLDRSELVASRGASKHKRVEVDEDEDDDESDQDDDDTFYLFCYYIDYDGLCYRPVRKRFSIRRFDGEKAITSFPFFPLRYVENMQQIREEHQRRGELFQKCINNPHMSHSGWTLAHSPIGSALRTRGGDMKTEFIDSPTIVDFEEAFNENPWWKPDFSRPVGISDNWAINEDQLPIMHWNDYNREKLISETYDNIQEDDGVTAWQRRIFLANDEFIKASKQHRFDERSNSRMELRPEDLELLPNRVFAYAFRERKHVALEVTRMRVIAEQTGVLQALTIPKQKKTMIQGLVNSHFEKKELEGKMDSENVGNMTQDIIRAKGKGLVILLHGVPGVGKTATAEAVALDKKRPLFSVTCGDIGSEMDDVDENLRRIFRLANRWDCILLIDEADVFLTERSRYDLARNALVSVFLRALEYYDGVLFLTTNRVGQLDEAFNSRLHLTLYYPPLTKKQTVQIFRTNIEKLRQIDAERRKVSNMPELVIDDAEILAFAMRQFPTDRSQVLEPGSQPHAFWNGRQIRNAFQIASSLAYHDMSQYMSMGGLNPSRASKLGSEQFEKVETTINEFKEYMKRTKGYSDAEMAYLNGTRADENQDSHMRIGQSNQKTTTTFAQQHQQNLETYNSPRHARASMPAAQGFGQSQYSHPSHLQTPPHHGRGYPTRPRTPNTVTQHPHDQAGFATPGQNVAGTFSVDHQSFSGGMDTSSDEE